MIYAFSRRALVALFAALCLGLAHPAFAVDEYAPPDPPSAAAMSVDVLLIRPLSLAATAIGTGVFVVSLPFSLLGLNTDAAAERLVLQPAAYTFLRPLGAF